jgi:acetyl esterase/lipase
MVRCCTGVLACALLANPAASVQGQDATPDGAALEGVEVIRDLPYARYGDRALQLDLYRPAEITDVPLPAVVLVRGGAWRRSAKEYFGPAAAELARRGFIAATIEIRASSEAIFPAAVHDVKAALRWLRAESDAYGVDDASIGVLGQSSGAHLALLTALTHGNVELEGNGGNEQESSAVQAVVGFGSATMFLPHPDLVPAQEFFGGPLDERREVWMLGSPLLHVGPESPPALLIYGADDQVAPRAQSLDFVEAYAGFGLDIEFTQFDDAPHTFWNRDPWRWYTIERVAQFLHRHLGPAEDG